MKQSDEVSFILALEIDAEVATRLTELRTQYFPADLNFLNAHITLFHKLPVHLRDAWESDVASIVENTSGFEVKISQPYSLGLGVALRVESEKLKQFHSKLQKPWTSWLTPQDRQNFNPHCTIQNKVTLDVARKTLAAMQFDWVPIRANARGVGLYKYLGGPWELEKKWSFRE